MKGCANMIKDNNTELCSEQCVHKDVIEKVNEIMPDEDIVFDLAELFKVFGDSTRLKILCDIAELLNMSFSAISHQLRVLKQSKLVKFRREGKTVIYSLSDDHVRSIIDQGLEHIEE